jgi:glycerol uptake facilitator protein
MTGHAERLWLYIPAQLAGAFLGAVLVWIFYHPHWKLTENPDFKLGSFCTIPAIRHPISNFVCEVIATFVLVLVAVAFTSKRIAPGGTPPGMGPILVGGLVWSIGLSLGGTTGYAINPARDLAPRLAHALLPISGKGSSDWSYAWIPFFGPICGAVLAALFVNWSGMV